jgi:hypothetical protein
LSVLRLFSLYDMQHVLNLPNLASLALEGAATMQAEELRRLTALSSLTHVQLGYRTDLPHMRRVSHVVLNGKLATVLTQHAADAWGLLPMRHLAIDTAVDNWRGTLPLEVMQRIGQLTGLTYLGCNAILPAGRSTNLCSALLCLKALCELRLDVFFEEAQDAKIWHHATINAQGDYSAVREGNATAATATQQLLQAVSQLPGLVRLSLGGLSGGFGAASVRQLAAAPALQRLQLSAGLLRRESGYLHRVLRLLNIGKMRIKDVQAMMSGRCEPCVVEAVGAPSNAYDEAEPLEV